MHYAELAKYYERLEATTKKLEKRDILAELYKNSGSLEIVVPLSMGIVFAAGQQELGVAREILRRVIAKTYGVTEEAVTKKFKETGDLGLTAEFFAAHKKQRSLASRSLTVQHVFDNLRKLPEISGSGSQERKMALISELLSHARPVEARYIMRTVLGDMRVGVAAGIARDAIALAFNKDPKEVEHVFNILGDYGAVAALAKSDKLKAELTVGHPVRVMLADRSPTLEESMKEFPRTAVEWKYDGFRCITGHTGIYTNPHGLKSVKDIKVGDKVLTHKGRFRKVIAINKRTLDKNERLFILQSYMGNKFRISEGHKILCKRGRKILWLPPEDIQKDDMLVFPLPKLGKRALPNKMLLGDGSGYKKEVKMDERFFRFLGYWIGDGFTNTYHHTERVGLIFNSKQKRLMKEYKNLIRIVFGIREISEYEHKNNAISIYWRDKPLRIWLSKYFRIEWQGKTIPWWFVDANPSNFKAFLRGWSESDGHKSPQGTTVIVTQEKRLASLAQIIGLMHAIPLGLRRLMIRLPRKDYKKEYYQIIIPKSSRNAACVGNYAYYRILRKEEVKRPDPRTTLYNLQVEDDQSYCTNNIVLHNCQIHKDSHIKIYSRRMEDVTKQFPDLVQWTKEHVRAKQCIIEGEAIAVKNDKPQPFQMLSRRIQRKYDIEKMVKEIPIRIHLFDLLLYEGKNYMNRPLAERWEKLKQVVKESKDFKLADHIETQDIDEAEKFYKEALKHGQEGVIVKNLEARYQPGKRVGYWLKVKEILEPLDLVVVGAEWGEGKRTRWLGSLILAAKKGDHFVETGRMASGLTEEQMEELTKKLRPLIISEEGKIVKVKPQIVIEVGYEEIQKSPKYESGYALRFPRLMRIRDDKAPKDANTTKDVEKFFRMQK